MDSTQLEQRIRAGIPISAHMDFCVRELGERRICVSGGADENTNVHGTAFAGSLYALCTLAAWGLTFSRLPGDAVLVLAEGRIRYLRPVTGEIVACCAPADGVLEAFLERLHRDRRSRVELGVSVLCDGHTAVQYDCQLHARLPR